MNFFFAVLLNKEDKTDIRQKKKTFGPMRIQRGAMIKRTIFGRRDLTKLEPNPM